MRFSLSLSLPSVSRNLLHRIFFRINSMWWQQLDSSYEATESFYVSPKPFCVRFKRTPIQYRIIHHFTFLHSYILTFSSCECLCFCIAPYTLIVVLVLSKRVHCWIFECSVIISSKCYMKRLRNAKITRIKHTHTHTQYVRVSIAIKLIFDFPCAQRTLCHNMPKKRAKKQQHQAKIYSFFTNVYHVMLAIESKPTSQSTETFK